MSLLNYTRVSIAAIALLYLTTSLSLQASADAVVGQTAPTLPLPSLRLEMPRSFDTATVQSLIDNIEEPRKSSILEIGYFYGRGNPSIPVRDGFALLKQALAKETIGSRRWFILQEVRGWAGLRNKEISPQESIDAYEDIFSYAEMAKSAKASFSLNKATNDFVFSMRGRFEELQLNRDERVQNLLLRAWEAYYSFPTSNIGTREPMWEDAIEKADVKLQFIPVVEQILNNTTVPKTYNLLTTAASIFLQSDRERAIALLKQAKPLLPNNDHQEAQRLYKKLIDLLTQFSSDTEDSTKKARFDEAISLQQEFIKTNGYGQAELLVLYARNGDEAAFDTLLLEIAQSANVPDNEANIAVTALNALYPQDKEKYRVIKEKQVRLLTHYLQAGRSRKVEDELKARLFLAQDLLALKKIDDAKAVLAIRSINTPQSSSLARQLRYRIHQMLQELQLK